MSPSHDAAFCRASSPSTTTIADQQQTLYNGRMRNPPGRRPKYDVPMAPSITMRIEQKMSADLHQMAKTEERELVAVIRRILRAGLAAYAEDPALATRKS